jgi:hypothetical protein
MKQLIIDFSYILLGISMLIEMLSQMLLAYFG